MLILRDLNIKQTGREGVKVNNYCYYNKIQDPFKNDHTSDYLLPQA